MADNDAPSILENRPQLLQERPRLLQQDRPIINSVRDSLPDDPQEPIIEPRIMEQWTEADLPFRGEVRQRVVKSLASDVRRRRTIDGLSARIATAAITPITNEMRNMATERIRQRLNEQAQRAIKGDR